MKNSSLFYQTIKLSSFALLSAAFLFGAQAQASTTTKKTTTTKTTKAAKVPRVFPHGCREIGFAFENNHLVLRPTPEEGSQTLYVIHNQSAQTIKINIDKDKSQFYVPDYTNIIDGDNWAAFATDRTEMKFNCYKLDSPEDTEGNPVSCGEILQLCQYNRAKFAGHNQGNYWIAKNSPQDKVVKIAIKRGILLRW